MSVSQPVPYHCLASWGPFFLCRRWTNSLHSGPSRSGFCTPHFLPSAPPGPISGVPWNMPFPSSGPAPISPIASASCPQLDSNCISSRRDSGSWTPAPGQVGGCPGSWPSCLYLRRSTLLSLHVNYCRGQCPQQLDMGSGHQVGPEHRQVWASQGFGLLRLGVLLGLHTLGMSSFPGMPNGASSGPLHT